jgi:hypothetical protein
VVPERSGDSSSDHVANRGIQVHHCIAARGSDVALVSAARGNGVYYDPFYGHEINLEHWPSSSVKVSQLKAKRDTCISCSLIFVAARSLSSPLI